MWVKTYLHRLTWVSGPQANRKPATEVLKVLKVHLLLHGQAARSPEQLLTQVCLL